MKVLVIGGGGREHALVWKIAQSPKIEQVFCAPGNPGMREATQVGLSSLEELAGFAGKNRIDLTIVGPEAPLCEGIVDVFREQGLCILGPDRQAAQLEGSKSFAKNYMWKYRIPTAKASICLDKAQAFDSLKTAGLPVVIKADGLAAGKGVVVAQTQKEAQVAVEACFDGMYGEAGKKVLVEECLVGEEASIIALTDGETIIPLASAQDHKRLGDGDTGPNTGGMGAYSPAPVVTGDLWRRIDTEILQRFLRGCREEKLDYRGFIYAGIMITKEGPRVLEFNVRLGDPETQPILMRLESDLIPVLTAAAARRLAGHELKWTQEPGVCVVMASGGYPGAYQKGKTITGIEAAEAAGAVVFHAGTKKEGERLITAGGRVLGVTAKGPTIRDAVNKAYTAVECIHWEGVCFRRDIAHHALNR